MSIIFTKMSGSGNDCIIIDNRELVIEASAKRDFVSKICVPKISVGADGVIFKETLKKLPASYQGEEPRLPQPRSPQPRSPQPRDRGVPNSESELENPIIEL